MRRWTWAVLALLALSASSPSARGNLRVFRPSEAPPGPHQVKLVLEVDDSVKEPRLQIPRALLRLFPAAQPRRGAGAWHLPTVVAGVALTLAFASGGLWLLRRSPRTAAAALLLALFALGGAALWANAPVFQNAPAQAPDVLQLPTGIRLPGKIVLEVVDGGDSVKLIVNKSMVVPGYTFQRELKE
jgi:hypothetical protein